MTLILCNMTEINSHRTSPIRDSQPVEASKPQLELERESKTEVLKQQDQREKTKAYERPGAEHAKRYVAAQKALEESKMKDIPDQYSSAEWIKAQRHHDLNMQVVIKESPKTMGTIASGISKFS